MFAETARRIGTALRCLYPLFQTSREDTADRIGRSLNLFPVAGLLFGTGCWLVYSMFHLLMDRELACVFLLFILYGFTQGGRVAAIVHLFRRPQTGARSPGSPERLSAQAGVVLGIVSLFMIKYLGLVHVGEGWTPKMVLLMPMISAWTWVHLCHSLRDVREELPESLGYIHKVKNSDYWITTTVVTIAMIGVMGLVGLFLLMFISLGTALLERNGEFMRRQPVDGMLRISMEVNENLLMLTAIAIRKVFTLAGSGTGIAV